MNQFFRFNEEQLRDVINYAWEIVTWLEIREAGETENACSMVAIFPIFQGTSILYETVDV